MSVTIRRTLERFLAPDRANFLCHLVEGVFASFGMGVAGGVILQLLVVRLGYSAATLGFIASLGMVGTLLQVLVAPNVEAARRKKRLVLLLGIGQRLPLLMIGLGVFIFGRRAPGVCIAILAAAQVIGGLSVRVLVAPWLDLLAETVPGNWLGRLFGLRNSISSALCMAAAGVNAVILVSLAFPANFALIYAIAFVSMAISWLIFALVDELPESAAPRQRQAHGHYYRDLVLVLRHDAHYRWFLGFQALHRLGGGVAAFYAMFAARHYGIGAAFVAGAFIVASRSAAIVGSLGLGAVAGRIGYRRMMEIGVVLESCAALLAVFASSGYAFVAVVFLTALGGAAGGVSAMPFTMRLFPRGRRVGYSALSAVALLPVGIVASVGLGVLLDSLYSVGFLFGAVLCLTAILPLEHCRVDESDVEDLRTEPAAEEFEKGTDHD